MGMPSDPGSWSVASLLWVLEQPADHRDGPDGGPLRLLAHGMRCAELLARAAPVTPGSSGGDRSSSR